MSINTNAQQFEIEPRLINKPIPDFLVQADNNLFDVSQLNYCFLDMKINNIRIISNELLIHNILFDTNNILEDVYNQFEFIYGNPDLIIENFVIEKEVKNNSIKGEINSGRTKLKVISQNDFDKNKLDEYLLVGKWKMECN